MPTGGGPYLFVAALVSKRSSKMADEEEPVVTEETEEETPEEEEEMVDPQEELKEKCGQLPQCSKLQEILDTCNERVEGKSNTTEDCNSELFDFIHCVDHCVAKNLFQRLK